MNNSIYQLECKIFFRNKAVWLGILILLISGFAGLYLGKKFIEKQQSVIAKSAVLQEIKTAHNIHLHAGDLGLLLFYNKFAVANIPGPWTAFANGQRDINPYLLSVSILALEGQMYDTDLNNPTTLLLGNMDLAFVIIFLFPLVIIAFSYNIVSGEQESGIWGLVKSQSGLPLQIILRKFSIRLITIFGVLGLLMIAAVIYLQLPVDGHFFMVLMVISFYVFFWFALCFWVVSRNQASSFNAVTLIACWVVLNIIGPAVLNVWLTNRYPIPEAMETVIHQREGNHEKWDREKHVTMDKFYEHYPQFKKYPFPSELTFSWYWYYAMQQMGDDEAAESAGHMMKKLEERQGFTNISSILFPGIQTQLGLNELAGSDLQSHLNFLKALKTYHEKLRLYFYPVIFTDGTANDIDWKKLKVEHYVNPADSGKIVLNLVFVAVFSLLLGLAGWYNFRKKLHTF
jgi:ABC-2 type transport system permease protein